MKVVPFSSLSDTAVPPKRTSVISIGVFDGVHKGHQAIFERLMAAKDELDADSAAVITFSINPKGSTGALDTLRLREEYIASFGVDVLAVIDFSPRFSKISAVGFVSLLRRAFNPIGAVVGSDFRFGNPQSQGNGEDLGKLLLQEGSACRVETIESVLDDEGERISSTRLRKMIEVGDLGSFLRLSGQFYRVDLVPLPYGSGSGELIFSRASIHQLLPPPGAYEAGLLTADRRCIRAEARIDGDSLRVLPLSKSIDGCGYGNGKEALPLDSLYLEKRR